MNKSKIKLEKEKDPFFQGGILSKSVKYALPFYKSKQGYYHHRLRYSKNHWVRSTGEYSHTSVEMWCGQGGQVNNGRLYAKLPEDSVLCATCEGRAIGAGLDGVREINGRAVMYSPNRRKK